LLIQHILNVKSTLKHGATEDLRGKSLKKSFCYNRITCKVEFQVQGSLLLGEFNEWAQSVVENISCEKKYPCLQDDECDIEQRAFNCIKSL